MGSGASICRSADVLQANPDGTLKSMQTWWQRFRDKKRLLKAVNENNLARCEPGEVAPSASTHVRTTNSKRTSSTPGHLPPHQKWAFI